MVATDTDYLDTSNKRGISPLLDTVDTTEHDEHQYGKSAETSLSKLPKRGRKPKYLHLIVLKGINAKDIHKRYKQNITTITDDFDKYITRPDLVGSRRQTFFYDAEKTNRFVVMKDHVDYGCLPYKTDLRCWHDHHTFSSSPIGIPIKYIPKKIDQTVESNDNMNKGENDYFITVGVVCSFACMLAFIEDNKHKQQYRNSKALAHLMYRKLYDEELETLPAADHRCLKEYGGDVSIDSYRKDFGSCSYIVTDNIKRPYMVAVGNWVQEKRCGII